MASGCPSLIQVTVVAGELAEVQVKLEEEDDPLVNVKLVIFGGAV